MFVGAWDVVPHHSVEDRVGAPPADLLDLVSPFAVLAAAALVLGSLRAERRAIAVAGVAAILFVHGHGIHLAANSIAETRLPPDAESRAYFFDERLGHIEWHLGWIGLLASFVLAERVPAAVRREWALGTVALLAPPLAAATVEGQSWWLVVLAAPLFVAAALRRRSHVAVACAASLTVAAAAIGLWAAWWDGVPQLTEVTASRLRAG